MILKRSLLGLIAALSLTFAAFIVYTLRDTSAKEGGEAPPFSITTDQGRQISATSFGGKLLVLNFWATWCTPCVQEIPSLDAFQRRFAGQGVVVVAVSVDKNPDKYKAFLQRLPVSFATMRDPAADVSAAYGTFQYPETYLIKDGKVVRKFPTYENWMSDDITQYVQGLL